MLTDVRWIGAGPGKNWSTASNWRRGDNANGVPAPEDDVIFDLTQVGQNGSKDSVVDAAFAGTIKTLTMLANYTGTITLERNLTVTTNFDQENGTIDGIGDLYLNLPAVSAVWSGGTQKGPGNTYVSGSELKIRSDVSDPVLDGRRFQIQSQAGGAVGSGWVVWESGNIQMRNSAKIVIASSGQNPIGNTGFFLANSAGSLGGASASGVFINGGQVTKQTGVTTSVDVPFENYGNGVWVQNGRLNFTAGGISTAGYQISGGADVWLMDSGTNTPVYEWIRGTSFHDSGFVHLFAKADLSRADNVNVENLEFVGGEIGGANPFFGCPGTLTIRRKLVWSGGAMKTEGAITNLNAGATAEIVANFGADTPTLDGRTFNNIGGSVSLLGRNLEMRNGAVFNNIRINPNAVGTFSFLDNSDILGDPQSSFANLGGVFQKTGGDGESKVGVPVISWGQIRSSRGKLKFDGGLLNLRSLWMLNGSTEAVGGDIAVVGGFEQTDGTTIVAFGNSLTADTMLMMAGSVWDEGVVQITESFEQDGGITEVNPIQDILALPASFEVVGAYQQDGGAVTVYEYGLLDVTGTLVINAGTLVDYQLIAADGAFQQNGGTIFVASYAGIAVTGDLEQIAGTLGLDGGTIDVTGTYSIAADALLEGGGTIYADLLSNAGTIHLIGSFYLLSSGSAAGNFNQDGSGRLVYEIGDLAGPRLHVDGTAELHGLVEVHQYQGFAISATFVFILLEYGDRIYWFQNVLYDPAVAPNVWVEEVYDDPPNTFSLHIHEVA